jgi:regulator of protease activity HflC (stomatin/prohibitin superfamily)
MSPEELQKRAVEELSRRKAFHLRLAQQRRADQAAHMAHGDRDTARTAGLLAAHHEQAAALAEAELRDRAVKASARQALQQKKVAASKPRPSRRPKVKDRITNMMLVEKVAGTTFKTLMQRWEREPLHGLRLVELEPGIYGVDDEDAEGVTGRYKGTTLQKMFSPKG